MNTITSELYREHIGAVLRQSLGSPIQTNACLDSADQVKVSSKILIIDDEPDIVSSLSKRLEFAGYEVASADEGGEALRVAIKIQPDVIILDIGMPYEDGHGIAHRIRSNTRTMFAQIIFLTARIGDEDRRKAMGAGAYGYLTKPFKSQELLQMIQNALTDRTF